MQTHRRHVADLCEPIKPLVRAVNALQTASDAFSDLPDNAAPHEARRLYVALARALGDCQALVFSPHFRHSVDRVQQTACLQTNIYTNN